MLEKKWLYFFTANTKEEIRMLHRFLQGFVVLAIVSAAHLVIMTGKISAAQTKEVRSISDSEKYGTQIDDLDLMPLLDGSPERKETAPALSEESQLRRAPTINLTEYVSSLSVRDCPERHLNLDLTRHITSLYIACEYDKNTAKKPLLNDADQRYLAGQLASFPSIRSLVFTDCPKFSFSKELESVIKTRSITIKWQ